MKQTRRAIVVADRTLRDEYCAAIPAQTLVLDAARRREGRVEILNATRPEGRDGWTLPCEQYDAIRTCILDTIDRESDDLGTVALQAVIAATQTRLGNDARFPGGRLRNYCTFVKVDLEARREIERLVGIVPQRIMRYRETETLERR